MSTCKRRCFFNTRNKEVQHAHTRFIVDDWSSVADDHWLLGNLVDYSCFYRHPGNQYDLQSWQRRRREKKVVEMKNINILGSVYRIIIDDYNTPELKEQNRSGYCFFDAKEIHVEDLDTDPDWKNESSDVKQERTRLILRHEIIHAFLNESGLCQSSNGVDAWAINEEMVDWMAIQFPKIKKAFEEAGCL